MSHEQAKRALDSGLPADAICATCPWDRLCVQPPPMSEREIQARIDEAQERDNARDPNAMPASALLTALTLGGRATAGALCPVFALRLRGPDGRQVADGIRHLMRTWGEPS